MTAVLEANLPAYREMATMGAYLWKKYGTREYGECAGGDLTPGWAAVTFPERAKAEEGETVVFPFIIFKPETHREQGNAKVMQAGDE